MTEEVKNIEFMAAYMEGDIIYGAGIELNLLFLFDIRTKKLSRLGVFDGFKNPNAFRVSKIFKYRESLYCFSCCSYEVAAYHLQKETFTYYSPDEKVDEEISIRCVCHIGNDVWIFREAVASSVWVFSMESGRYFKYEIDTSVLRGYDFSFLVASETCVYFDKHIWRCLPGNSLLLVYDVHSFELDVVKLEVPISSYTVSYANERILILGRDGKQIVVWEPNTNKTIVWETGYEGVEDRPFRGIVCRGKRLFLVPCFEDKIYYYEIQEDELSYKGYIVYPKEFHRLHYIGSQSMFLEYTFRNKNELYLFSFGGNGMICLNTDSLEIEFYPVQISEEDYIVGNTTSKMLLSDNQVGVENLVDYMRSKITCQKKDRVRENLTGNKCWERLKGTQV